jgi:hypothetical protein
MMVGQFEGGSFTLDQILTFTTSREWQYNQNGFREMVILLDEHLPAMMHVEIESYALAPGDAAAAFAACLKLPGGRRDAPRQREELRDRHFHFEGRTDSGVRVKVWKRTHLLGDQLRIATFALQINPQRAHTATAAAITARVIETIRMARFAPVITSSDRVAPTPELKQTGVSTVLRFRVPAQWTRGKLEEWTIFESGDRKLGVFEARYDLYPFSLAPSPKRRARVLFLLNCDHPGLKDAVDWLGFRAIDDSFTPPELTVTFRRVFLQGEDILDVWFCYRVDARHAEDRAVQDLMALFDREVRQAVITFPDPTEGLGAGAVGPD